MITNRKLDEYCADIAQEIFDDVQSGNCEHPHDAIYEYADGSEYVIYYAKAHELCQNCDITSGEDFADDISCGNEPRTYDQMATVIAYGEIAARIGAAYMALEKEAAE